jgi:hypothetical protein
MYADYTVYALQDREIREQELSSGWPRAGGRRWLVPLTLPASPDDAPSLRASGSRGSERVLEGGLGEAGSEGPLMRRNSPQGALGHRGMRFILLERYVERSDS